MALVVAFSVAVGVHGAWRGPRPGPQPDELLAPGPLVMEAENSNRQVWKRETQDGQGVAVYSDRRYEVSIGSKTWLTSAPVLLHTDSQWFVDPLHVPVENATRATFLKFKRFSEKEGTDQILGRYEEIGLEYEVPGKSRVPMTLAVQFYPEKELFLFKQRLPKGLKKTNTTAWDMQATLGADNVQHKAFLDATNPRSFVSGVQEGNSDVEKDVFTMNWPSVGQFLATGQALIHFPSFLEADTFPDHTRHLTWNGRFATARWGAGLGGAGGQEGGPLVLFAGEPTSAGSLPTMVLAPFDNFKSNILGYNCTVEDFIGSPEYTAQVCAGPHAHLEALPKQFESTFSLSFSSSGPTDAMHTWGKTLRGYYKKETTEGDVLTNKLSYWTDNGAYYSWYSYDNLMEKGRPADVLMNLAEEFQENKIPVHYYQLDAYWFKFERENANCKLNWEEQSHLFPDGLKSLGEKMNSTWLYYDGPTCAKFEVENLIAENKEDKASSIEMVTSNPYNLTWAQGQLATVHPNHAKSYFRALMKQIKEKGAAGYEIDFMDFGYLLFKHYNAEIETAHNYLAAMNDAAVEHSLPIQYCMPLPSDLLASVQHSAVTNARASQDYQIGEDNWNIAATALLHEAVGLRSSKVYLASIPST